MAAEARCSTSSTRVCNYPIGFTRGAVWPGALCGPVTSVWSRLLYHSMTHAFIVNFVRT